MHRFPGQIATVVTPANPSSRSPHCCSPLPDTDSRIGHVVWWQCEEGQDGPGLREGLGYPNLWLPGRVHDRTRWSPRMSPGEPSRRPSRQTSHCSEPPSLGLCLTQRERTDRRDPTSLLDGKNWRAPSLERRAVQCLPPHSNSCPPEAAQTDSLGGRGGWGALTAVPQSSSQNTAACHSEPKYKEVQSDSRHSMNPG